MPRRREEPFAVLIPENINVDLLLERNPCNVKNARDYILVILSLFKRNSFEVILATTLQHYCDNYRPLIVWLKNLEVIDVEDDYRYIDGIAKRYKINSRYNVPLREELIYTGTLIRKLKDANPNQLNSENPLLTQESEETNDHLYEYYISPVWVPYEVIAERLKLKPRKMVQGLRQKVEILDPGIEITDLYDYSPKLYRYILVEKGKFTGYKLLLDENKIDFIQSLADDFPELFPKVS